METIIPIIFRKILTMFKNLASPRFLSRLKSQVSSRHFYEKVLEDYKRTQNERLVNAFAGRLLKTYSPGRHNEDQEADSETDVPFGRKAK